MQKFISIAFIFFVALVKAQVPTGYYNNAQGLQGLALKQALHNIIDNHNSVSYNSIWNHFQNTDSKTNGKVWDIYSDVPNGTPPYSYTFNTNQCGSYSVEGDCYNREHSWPQSWFNSQQVPSSDLFHVYPTDGKVNGLRSNYPYGNVAVSSTTTLNGGKLGTSATLDYTGIVFEPIDEYKGDLARSYFYMSTRYYSEDSGWSNASGQMANKSEILPWGLALLLSWHHADTVSIKEIDRNNAIYQIQNNRNPFIDNPQWADSIWANVVTNYKKTIAAKFNFIVQPNPTSSNIAIEISGEQPSNVLINIRSTFGQIVLSKKMINISETIDLTGIVRGVYFVELQSDSNSAVRKLIIE